MDAIPVEPTALVFFVNGIKVVDSEFDVEWSLATYLRRKLHLTGTKIGCNEGGCGACTVMVSYVEQHGGHLGPGGEPTGKDSGSPESPVIRHLAVNACLVPLPWIHGQAVTTVEGIGSNSGSLHALQKRIAESHGTQCGFCTPGFVMSMYAMLRNKGSPTFADMQEAFQGNLCRCTGYRPILEGFAAFVKDPSVVAGGGGCCGNREEGSAGCCKSGGVATDVEVGLGRSLVPPSERSSGFLPFDPTQEPIFPPALLLERETFNRSVVFPGKRVTWYAPNNLKELLEIKKQNPEAKLIGGNTELGIEVRQKGAFFPRYINARMVAKMTGVHCLIGARTAGEVLLSIGGAATLAEVHLALEGVVKTRPDLGGNGSIPKAFMEMLSWFSGQQVRNVATLAGNIVTCSPISDLNPLLAAVGAKLLLASGDPSNTRELAIDSGFFTGYRKNPIRPDEVVVRILIPLSLDGRTTGASWTYVRGYKVAKRRDDDIAIVNAGFRVTLVGAPSGGDPNSERKGSSSSSLSGDPRVACAEFWFGGTAAVTQRAEKACAAAVGKVWNQELLEEILNALREDVAIPFEAPGGKSTYRETMASSFLFKFWADVSRDLFQDECNPDLAALEPLERSSTLKASQVYQMVPDGQGEMDPVGRPVVHSSAFEQATGEARFLDDMPHFDNELHLAPVLSTRALAKVEEINGSAAMALQGVLAVLTSGDLPEGRNSLGLDAKDERVFHSREVTACGQVVAAVVATTPELAREAAALVKVTYGHHSNGSIDDNKPTLTIQDAISKGAFYYHDELSCGDVEEALQRAPFVVEGEARVGGQEHFYLEPQATLAVPKGEKGELEIHTTTQWPALVQEQAAEMLGVPSNRIVVKVKRIGGGFGGKEIRNFILALPTILAARKFNRPVRCVLTRAEDMKATGQRHGYLGKYKVGYNGEGKLLAADIQLYQNAGYSHDVSIALIRSSMMVCTNAYKIPAVRVRGFCCQTNLPSNTAMRAAGVVQPLMICEQFVQRVVEELATKAGPGDKAALLATKVRRQNLFRDGDATHYGKLLEDCTVLRCWDECDKQAGYEKRLEKVVEFNRANAWRKRGIAMIPVKFNLAFPAHLNQAAALVMIYKDGSVLISHAGVELGQGVQTKLMQIASRALQVPIECIHTADTATDKIPNATSTAASFTTDLNGPAVLEACEKLHKRLQPYRESNPNGIFRDWVQAAYLDRVSLTATGFHKTPGLDFDWETKTGNPSNYSSYGVGCSEVEIDCLTGEHKVIRADIVMDVGTSLNPAVDVGQIEGAFVQGYGLWTMEQLEFSAADGSLRTAGPSNYKIPAAGDIPQEMRVTLLQGSANKHAIYSSKGIGEPPLFLSASVCFAIREAIRSAREDHGLQGYFRLDTPATVDKIRMACGDRLISGGRQVGSPSPHAVPWTLDVE